MYYNHKKAVLQIDGYFEAELFGKVERSLRSLVSGDSEPLIGKFALKLNDLGTVVEHIEYLPEFESLVSEWTTLNLS
jgi:hypothetical protein